MKLEGCESDAGGHNCSVCTRANLTTRAALSWVVGQLQSPQRGWSPSKPTWCGRDSARHWPLSAHLDPPAGDTLRSALLWSVGRWGAHVPTSMPGPPREPRPLTADRHPEATCRGQYDRDPLTCWRSLWETAMSCLCHHSAASLGPDLAA